MTEYGRVISLDDRRMLLSHAARIARDDREREAVEALRKQHDADTRAVVVSTIAAFVALAAIIAAGMVML